MKTGSLMAPSQWLPMVLRKAALALSGNLEDSDTSRAYTDHLRSCETTNFCFNEPCDDESSTSSLSIILRCTTPLYLALPYSAVQWCNTLLFPEPHFGAHYSSLNSSPSPLGVDVNHSGRATQSTGLGILPRTANTPGRNQTLIWFVQHLGTTLLL